MKRNGLFLGVVILLCVVFISAGLTFAEPIKLKAVGFLPKNNPMMGGAVMWCDRVNKELKGKVSINYLGGPEITAPVEQIQALKNGIFDINLIVSSYYAPLAPEVNALQLSKLMPWDERKSGFFDYMVDRHKKIGVVYLGRHMYGPFYIWVKKPVKDIEELQKLKLRAAPMYTYFFGRLGVGTVAVKPTDVYTALERGMVDGFGWPLLGAREDGWTEHCKYVIDHSFYGMDATILFNQDAWNKIPKPIQDDLTNLTIKYERDMVAHFQQENDKEREMLKKTGVKFITFSEAEGKKYVQMAYDAYWDDLAKKVPNLIPDLKKLSGN